MPRVEYGNRIEWRNEEGEIHRLDGPAIEWADGTKEWWAHGKYHRLDGPAVERADGTKEWWVSGRCIALGILTKRDIIDSLQRLPVQGVIMLLNDIAENE